MLSVTFSKTKRFMPQRLSIVLNNVVKELPEDICRHLSRGQKPNGGRQPKNKASTIRAKGHSIPGVDTGYLSDPKHWHVNRIKEGWEIIPPALRKDAIFHLKPKGYEFLGFPEEWKQKIRLSLRSFFINLKQ